MSTALLAQRALRFVGVYCDQMRLLRGSAPALLDVRVWGGLWSAFTLSAAFRRRFKGVCFAVSHHVYTSVCSREYDRFITLLQNSWRCCTHESRCTRLVLPLHLADVYVVGVSFQRCHQHCRDAIVCGNMQRPFSTKLRKRNP
jgi:hypothetical protein